VRVAVIGAGSWGTTLADLLAGNGHEVRIWAREPEVVESINRDHVNTVFLADSRLAETLAAHADIGAALEGTELVVSAAPSHAVRQVSADVGEALSDATMPVVSISKGLEAESLKLMSEVLSETLPQAPVVALSGPSFAQEVYERQPTAVVAASSDQAAAELVQQAFSTALKLGHNTLAALITRGLAEMSRVGEAMGASPRTFAGLAGMGDLLLTATGALSRNRSLGIELAEGRTLEEIQATRRTVAEGVRTARAAVQLAERAGTELPIAVEVANILFEGKRPEKAVRDLMERELKAEHWR
jgi:glycerol-3-phosphate dehydrogenase (NAD(P)+)